MKCRVKCLPDIQFGTIRNSGSCGCNGPEHRGECEQGRHAHGDPARYMVERYEEGEPAYDDEQAGGEVRAEQVVGNLPHQNQLHCDT